MNTTVRPKLPVKRRIAVKAEEYRQASRIHGGVLGYCGAYLGVRLSRMPIPTRRLRSAVYRHVYGKKYAVLDESELDRPLADYRTFNALFTRGLRPEARQVSTDPEHVACPCDGTVQEVGRVERDTLVTAKGIRYSVGDLLADDRPHPFTDGQFCVIFLSPADCHRVFCPYESRIESVAHVPGSRLLVHPPFQRPEFPVYSLNERVIFRLGTPIGACALVMVAGWGVGNVRLQFDRAFRGRSRTMTRKSYDRLPVIAKGDWLATFELGSTVVLLVENTPGLRPLVVAGEKVRYGQPGFDVGTKREKGEGASFP